jgi:hypothetical protein
MNDLDQIKEQLRIMAPDRDDPEAWITREGKVVPIKNMTDRHLLNTLLFIKRKIQEELRKKYLHMTNPPLYTLDYYLKEWKQYVGSKYKDKFQELEKEMLARGFDDWESRQPNDIRRKKRQKD